MLTVFGRRDYRNSPMKQMNDNSNV